MTQGSLRWPRSLPVLLTLGILVVIVGALLYGAGRLLESLQSVLIPILIALALSYLLEPIVDWLVSKKIRREAAILLTLATTAAAALAAALLAAPIIAAQLVQSAQKVPQAISRTSAAVRPALDRLHEVNPAAYDWAMSKVNAAIQNPSGLTEPVIGSLKSAASRFAEATSGLLDLVLIPFFVFYFLSEGAAWRRAAIELVPQRHRQNVVLVLEKVDRVASNFVRGQLSVCGVMALCYVALFAIIGTPLPIALGIISGFAHLVPYVGTLTAALLTLALTGLDSPGLWRALFIIASYASVQSLEGFVLTPRILGGRLQLHPFVVIVGVLTGGSLFGMIGVILAAPVVAILKVLLGFAADRYKQSRFYRDEEGQDCEKPA